MKTNKNCARIKASIVYESCCDELKRASASLIVVHKHIQRDLRECKRTHVQKNI